MQKLSTIINSQSMPQEESLSTGGFALWIIWDTEHESTIIKSLQDLGGLEITNVTGQSLWFFFGTEVLYALATLDIWAKQYSQGVTAFALPGNLSVGIDNSLHINIEQDYEELSTETPKSIVHIYAHGSLASNAASIPGINLFEARTIALHEKAKWKLLTADRRLPYLADHNWFLFIRPVGNPLDSGYQAGWTHFFPQLIDIIDEHKTKYILQDGFLILLIDKLQHLRSITSKVINVLHRIRTETPEFYWPCTFLVSDKNKLNLSGDLPSKIAVKWDSLRTDAPYFTYKNAYLLGNEFNIHDLKYSSESMSIHAWCTVNLRNLDSSNTLNILMPSFLVPDETPCFYCGSSTHMPSECPSKSLAPPDPDFWKDFTSFSMDGLNATYRYIANSIQKDGLAAYGHLINDNEDSSTILKAVFAINSAIQTPNIKRIWKNTNANMDVYLPSQKKETEKHWRLLERFMTATPGEMLSLEKNCQEFLVQNSRNWQTYSILGFIAVERGDFYHALHAWREANLHCSTTLHQAWITFLIARLYEMRGQFSEAIDHYLLAAKLLPTWDDILYRQLVCQAKQGFGELAAGKIKVLIQSKPEIFHKVLLDPELHRGHTHLLQSLSPIWEEAAHNFKSDRQELEQLLQTLSLWFEEHENPMILYSGKIQELLDIGITQNYLNFLKVSLTKPELEEDVTRIISNAIRTLKKAYEDDLKYIEYIRDEMSWFLFQRALINFNAAFNGCAAILNWAFVSDFNNHITFKEAQTRLPELDMHVDALRKRLHFLRMVRDFTLFGIIMLRSFINIAIVLLILSTGAIFLFMFAGEYFGMGQLQRLINANFWSLIKASSAIVVMVALGLSSLKATVTFEKKRNKLLDEAKILRLKNQQIRVEKAKQIRIAADKKQQQTYR